jgi:hypothetical protein
MLSPDVTEVTYRLLRDEPTDRTEIVIPVTGFVD